ncbi:MAG: hypothetical protein WDM91_03685 [Rhizomicrobium sp.]
MKILTRQSLPAVVGTEEPAQASEPAETLREPPVRLVDLIFFVAGVLVAGLGIAVTMAAEGKGDELVLWFVTSFSLVLCISLSIVAVLLLLRSRDDRRFYAVLFRAYQRMRRQRSEAMVALAEHRSTAATEQDRLKRKIAEVEHQAKHLEEEGAIQYRRQGEKQAIFLAAFVRLVAECRAHGQPETVTSTFQELKTLHDELLSSICDTTAVALARIRPLAAPKCSINIKHFLPAPRGGLRYLVMSRSNTTDLERLREYERMKDAPYLFAENYVYTRILNEGEIVPGGVKLEKPNHDDARIERGYYLSGDVERDILNVIQNGDAYRQPTRRALHWYKSCLAVPVMGPHLTAGGRLDIPPGIGYIRQNRNYVLGVMCADNGEKDFFNTGYDLNIMREAALLVFNYHKLFVTAQALADTLVHRTPHIS